MKKRSIRAFLLLITLLSIWSLSCSELLIEVEGSAGYEFVPVVSGLRNPMAIDTDGKGNVWIAEAGTGNSDGAVVMISPDRTKTILTSGFYAVKGADGVEGLTGIRAHDDRWVTVLNGADGMIYAYNVEDFIPGSLPLPVYTNSNSRDYGSAARSYRSSAKSRIFDTVFDESDNGYFVDAGANLIMKWYYRDGSISVFAEIPPSENGTEAVPTGIVYDGNKLLVSTFSGPPYAAGSSRIYAVDLAGNVTLHKDGLTAAARLELTPQKGLLITRYGDYTGDKFVPNTGAILNEKGEELLEDLPLPIDVKSIDSKSFYFLSNQTGTLYKASLIE